MRELDPNTNMRCPECHKWLIEVHDGLEHAIHWVVCRQCELIKSLKGGIKNED
ncbi:MAG: hypothetical protein Q7J12_00160 [Syntrophales bacterium]|nr:hypothetical protein [Syntrophales bacterium]